MKGLICCYSGSGNTMLACQYLMKNVASVEWTLYSILDDKLPDTKQFDVFGFATFTDFWSIPEKMRQFIGTIQPQEGKPAFVFTTFGMVAFFSMRDLARDVANRGFRIIDGFMLHTPENFPPMICGGMGNENSPSSKELHVFNAKLKALNKKLAAIKSSQSVPIVKPGEAFILTLLSAPKRTTARVNMGEKFVDEILCTQCGICRKVCPYNAIILDPGPKFDMKLCYGCWACYNHCPQKAIFTSKFRNRGHYPSPVKKLMEKLK